MAYHEFPNPGTEAREKRAGTYSNKSLERRPLFPAPPALGYGDDTSPGTKTREKRAITYSNKRKERLSFEEVLEEVTGQETVIEGQPRKQTTIKEHGQFWTEDKGHIPDPSFMLHPRARRDRFFDQSSSLWKFPTIRPTPRPMGKSTAQRPRGDVREGMMVVRKKAEANILKGMSIEDIFGELINKYQILPSDIRDDVANIEVSEYWTAGGSILAILKAFFANKLATERINMGYPLDIPEI
jgi:hypothetical protein